MFSELGWYKYRVSYVEEGHHYEGWVAADSRLVALDFVNKRNREASDLQEAYYYSLDEGDAPWRIPEGGH